MRFFLVYLLLVAGFLMMLTGGGCGLFWLQVNAKLGAGLIVIVGGLGALLIWVASRLMSGGGE